MASEAKHEKTRELEAKPRGLSRLFAPRVRDC